MAMAQAMKIPDYPIFVDADGDRQRLNFRRWVGVSAETRNMLRFGRGDGSEVFQCYGVGGGDGRGCPDHS